MAIKSLKELPKGKRRISAQQVERAKKTKAIKVKHRVIGRERGRTEVSLGTHDKENVAGVVKGFRQKTKGDIGVILKDSDGNVIARTHIAKGHTTIPEQLVVRALSKYGKTLKQLTVVLTVRTSKGKKKKK
jgi:hypothetical protein